MPWDPVEHTADAGIRVRARSPEALFEEAARGLTDTIVDVGSVRSGGERAVAVEGVDESDLLVRFLGEVLYLYDVERFLTAEARIETLGARTCRAVLRGEVLDPGRHGIRTEIKAVTYHASGIRRTPDGWEADVIFDL